MDLKSLPKKVLLSLVSPTAPVVAFLVCTGNWFCLSVQALQRGNVMLGLFDFCMVVLMATMSALYLVRRDRQRDAEFLLKLAAESQCTEGDACCADDHCSTEAKPEQKVC